ncbi:DUF6059 family protein [Streptomyces fuscichromogenes]|uniref:DUF6059 family protein n=1 Tax=Streptomyces fuscichromogenes TaxID=1324013 RepID=UPI00381B4018
MKRALRWGELFARWTPGLLAMGCCLWGLQVLPEIPVTEEPTGPPPGHPERLAVDVPLTEAERQLWSILGLNA